MRKRKTGHVDDDQDITRRALLLLMATAVGLVVLSAPSFASDDDGGSDSSGSDSDNSGSGSSGSGSDDDDNDDDGGDDEDNSGSGKNGADYDNDQDDARDAVKKGKAITLSRAMTIVKKRYPGRVIEVKLFKRGTGLDYRFKIIASGGSVKNVSMDATNGRIRGFLGF